MRTIFDINTRTALIGRIEKINEENKAKWGKMNVFQMLKHNTYWNGWILGNDDHTYKQEFLGKIFGKIALKKMIKDEKPLDKNIPTSDQFKVMEMSENLESEQAKWILLIKDY